MLKPDSFEFREIIVDEVRKAFNINGFHEVKMIPFTHSERSGREWGMKFEIVVPSIDDENKSDDSLASSIVDLILEKSMNSSKMKFSRYELVVGFNNEDSYLSADENDGEEITEADRYENSFVYFTFIPIIRGNIMDVIKGVNPHFKQTTKADLSYSINFNYTERPHYVSANYDGPDEQYTQYLLGSDEVSEEMKEALRISLIHAPIFAEFIDNLAEYLGIAATSY